MRFRRFLSHRRNRLMGIVALILSVVHGPLPSPDYHNIRHQDADGEVCEHHDHLLRWHPGAGYAEDVVVFHWHWFFPANDQEVFGFHHEGPAFHAHSLDCDATTVKPLELSIDTTTRYEVRLASGGLDLSPFDPLSSDFSLRSSFLAIPWEASTGILARGNSIQAVLHRWDC